MEEKETVEEKKQESKKTLLEKLQIIHSGVVYIEKSKQGKQFQYAGSSDVLGQVHELMDEQKVLLLPNVTNYKVTTSKNAKGSTVFFTEIELDYTWVDTERSLTDPTARLTSHWVGQGIDTGGEKGVGKALTYAEKYFLLKFFNVATDKLDPDSFQQDVKSKKKPDPISDDQKRTIIDLVETMSGVVNKSVSTILSGYLGKAQVKKIDNLSYESANDLIELITRQLDQQVDKGDMNHD